MSRTEKDKDAYSKLYQLILLVVLMMNSRELKDSARSSAPKESIVANETKQPFPISICDIKIKWITKINIQQDFFFFAFEDKDTSIKKIQITS